MRISILISIFVTSILIAQPIKHLISPDFGGPRDLFIADLDGDGDLDVAASGHLDGLAWWENSQGVFGPEQGIESGSAYTVAAGTIDADSIVDIVSGFNNELVWFQGPAFSVKHVIDTGPGYASPSSIQLVDMDSDGDLDLLASNWGAHDILWRENGNNWAIHTIVSSWTNPVQAVAFDINSDGDLDVIATSRTLDRVSWFEGPLWVEHIIDNSLDGAHIFDLGDIDGDGDTDIAASAWSGNEVVWYSWPSLVKSQIATGLGAPCDVSIGDINLDGQADILCAEQSPGAVLWWEGPGWIEHIVDDTFTYANRVYLADIDENGSLDPIAGGQPWTPGEIAWWELGYTGLNSHQNSSLYEIQLSVQPNPFSSILEITYTLTETSEVDLAVYDMSGRRVMGQGSITSVAGSHSISVSTENLPVGYYQVVLRAGDSAISTRCVKID